MQIGSLSGILARRIAPRPTPVNGKASARFLKLYLHLSAFQGRAAR